MQFAQAGIPVQQEKEFGQLRNLVERVLSPSSAEPFLKQVKRRGLRVRQFEGILNEKIFEAVDREFGKTGQTAVQLYGALTVTDQAQMREFYLTQVEQITPALRAKYHTQFETF